MRPIARCVTIPIACVTPAMSRHFFLPRRPHILPDTRIRNATRRRRRWILRHAAPGRWRTRIVINPVHNVSDSDVRPNVVRGNNRRAFPFIHHNPRTINSRAKFLLRQRLRPRTQIRAVPVKKSAALFHIQKNHRAFRKALPPSGRRRGSRIRKPSLNRILFIGKLPGSPSLIQQQKAKSLRFHQASLANPRIGLLSRRRAQPITGKGIGFAKQRQRGVTGILVAVKSQKAVNFGGTGSRRIKLCEANRNSRKGKQKKNQNNRRCAHAPNLHQRRAVPQKNQASIYGASPFPNDQFSHATSTRLISTSCGFTPGDSASNCVTRL